MMTTPTMMMEMKMMQVMIKVIDADEYEDYVYIWRCGNDNAGGSYGKYNGYIMMIIIDDADYEYIVNESMIIGRQFVQMFAIK